jgi:hypothetical protein
MRLMAMATVIATCTAVAPLAAGEIELVRIDRVAKDTIASRAFVLDGPRRVSIGGVKLQASGAGEMTSAWILDGASRQVVWELGQAREVDRRGRTARFKGSADLDAGTYEVYFTTHPPQRVDGGFRAWLRSAFSFSREKPDEALRRLELWIRGVGRPLGDNTADRVRSLLETNAFITTVCVGDDQLITRGFRLASDADVHIYALGEVTGDGTYDSGWILDAPSRTRVWSLDYWGSDHAGGARKNRRAETVIRLKAGDYAAQYASDDSHSCSRFNAAPPHDPFAWGLTLGIADADQRSAVSTFEYHDVLDRQVIVSIDRVRDDEHRIAGFSLLRASEVLVHAVGEGEDGQMFDSGWIVDAQSRETVWTMRYRSSEHAGGGDKNRMVQEVLTLPAGSYIVHFVTDGSHSFGGWNDSPPFEPGRWGITVVCLCDGDVASVVTTFDPDQDPQVLAAVRRVQNRAMAQKRFTMDRDREVTVYALGEGHRGKMFDYGWIERADDHSRVWTMEYWMTRHAGGADKNRGYRGRLDLPAGEYVLSYVSDGSHAYRSWNASPPHDPDSWGITVFIAEPPPHLEDPGS